MKNSLVKLFLFIALFLTLLSVNSQIYKSRAYVSDVYIQPQHQTIGLPGSRIQLGFVIINPGPSTFNNVVFRIILPAGLSFAGTTSGVSCKGGGQFANCNIGYLGINGYGGYYLGFVAKVESFFTAGRHEVKGQIIETNPIDANLGNNGSVLVLDVQQGLNYTPFPINLDSSSDDKSSKLQKVKLPKKFNFEGSKTTDFSKVKDDSKVSDLTFDVKDSGRVVFQNDIDLSDSRSIKNLNTFDRYSKFIKGHVNIDTSQIPKLNSPAAITMYDMNLINGEYKIYRGVSEDSNITRNSTYDKSNKILTFNVSFFSNFEVVPKFSVSDSLKNIEETLNDESINIKGSVGDLDADIKLVRNGEILNEDYVIDNYGEFNFYNVNLIEGDNHFILETSTSGITAVKDEFTVRYQERDQIQLPFISNVWVVLTASFAIFFFLTYGVYRTVLKDEDAYGYY